tara:strand:+ start:3587 stop:4363 length:777 start_codon:yes stop_codon:yes gene_type:complete
MKSIHVLMGWDAREIDAYNVAEHSLIRRSSIPITVTPLKHNELREHKLFYREWKIDKHNQYYDLLDKAPFSTEFSHTRFLVPEIARRNNLKGWAIFCDCDFLWLDDIKNLVDQLDDGYPVMSVPFNYESDQQFKMDNKIQTKYNCKLWSSLMAFNMEHEDNKRLTVEAVNKWKGLDLHQFSWLTRGPESVGEINPFWNYVPDITEYKTNQPNAVHFSLGGPWLRGYEECDFSKQWYLEKTHMDSLITKSRAPCLKLTL